MKREQVTSIDSFINPEYSKRIWTFRMIRQKLEEKKLFHWLFIFHMHVDFNYTKLTQFKFFIDFQWLFQHSEPFIFILISIQFQFQCRWIVFSEFYSQKCRVGVAQLKFLHSILFTQNISKFIFIKLQFLSHFSRIFSFTPFSW